MAKKTSLRTEVDALRDELAALREERASAESDTDRIEVADEEADYDQSVGGAMSPDLAEFEHAINEFIRSTKIELSERPAIAVALALLLGIVIGRLSRS